MPTSHRKWQATVPRPAAKWARILGNVDTITAVAASGAAPGQPFDTAHLAAVSTALRAAAAHDSLLTPITYSWADEDMHVVIASELVDGGSLSTLIGDYGALAEDSVAAILDQVLLALEHVHGAGLVHRDVKPANLLLHATGSGALHLRLGDFGLAMGARDAHLTQVGTVVGTPGYLPPELLRGGVSPDPRHDLFAAGQVALAAGVEPTELCAPVVLGSLRPGRLHDVLPALTNLEMQRRPCSAHEARAWLRSARSDPCPRTREGEPIEVLHQLPPLSAEAMQEAGATRTQVLATSATKAAPNPSPTRV